MAFFNRIEEICTEVYRTGEKINCFDLQDRLMDMEGLPMHCPPHHYMIPAVLLTVLAVQEGTPEDIFIEQLAVARERARNVLGGFCGWYGNCGAGVGVGIFMSVYTDTSPHSEEYWAECNRATGKALLRISEVEGPRCCKRNSYLSLYSAIDTIREVLEIDLEPREKCVCRYYERNADCKKEKCPFYPETEVVMEGEHIVRACAKNSSLTDVRVPERMKPDRTFGPNKDCDCMKREHLLKYKTGFIHWLVEEEQKVAEGDPLCEVEIEKKVFVVPAPVGGIVKQLYVEDDTDFSCREPICSMET